MAKSVRAKCKAPHKLQKRTDPKSAYAVAEAARLEKLHARLKERISQPIIRISDHEEKAESEMDIADGEQLWLMVLGLVDQDELSSSEGGYLAAVSVPQTSLFC
jgi:hypothetical protein